MYNPLGFEKVRDFSMAHRVNMISAENNQVVLKTFTGDSVIEFDKWTRRFNDIVRLQGNKWNENDKIAHLKFFLDGTPRRMFDTLSADETKTLKDVIENLRKKMDTPQRRELTYQALAACKQEGNEQVKVFLDRLIPLIDATAQNLTPEAKEEVQCRMLLEKLRPDISFILRTAALGTTKKFESLCMQAKEAEMMLLPNMVKDNSRAECALAVGGNDFGGYSNSLYNNPPTERSHFTPRGAENSEGNEEAPENETYCEYCQDVGHVSDNCAYQMVDLIEENDQLRYENEFMLNEMEEWKVKLQSLMRRVEELEIQIDNKRN